MPILSAATRVISSSILAGHITRASSIVPRLTTSRTPPTPARRESFNHGVVLEPQLVMRESIILTGSRVAQTRDDLLIGAMLRASHSRAWRRTMVPQTLKASTGRKLSVRSEKVTCWKVSPSESNSIVLVRTETSLGLSSAPQY